MVDVKTLIGSISPPKFGSLDAISSVTFLEYYTPSVFVKTPNEGPRKRRNEILTTGVNLKGNRDILSSEQMCVQVEITGN